MNQQGRLQGAARAISPPGEAMEDWQIFVNVGRGAGRAAHLRVEPRKSAPTSPRRPHNERYAGLTTLAFARPVSARTWLQASNPVRTLEVGLHVPGSAAREVRRTARHSGVDDGDSAY